MRKQRGAVEAVALEPRGGETVAVAGLRAELEEQIRGRQPLHLHAVLPELPAEHGLVDQRLIDEVPGMRMDFVEIAEAGEEASALDGQSISQRGGAEERLLDFDLVVAGDRRGEHTGEVRIDAGAERQLGLAEIEAALAGTDLVARRNEARDVPVRRDHASVLVNLPPRISEIAGLKADAPPPRRRQWARARRRGRDCGRHRRSRGVRRSPVA